MPIPETAPERRTRSDRRKPAAHPIGDELREALERGEIEILFQPQFASADGTLVGAEALARWQHRRLGRIGADKLFAIAALERFARRTSPARWPRPAFRPST